ncbi:MAG: InlB B-repeat-containing protein [Ruminococcus flavefaciens]|nr:InlB B-repeat-containing protein [Ruminococcus flavefaciens]
MPSATVEDGGKVTKPEDPTKADCTFEKWYSDEALSTEWSFENGIVLSDKTLYAGWLDARPVATFDSDGGTAVEEQRVSGGKITEPAAPQRNGYDFDGWYSGETKWNFDTDTATSNTTLKAHWTKKQNLTVSKETALDLSQGQYNIVTYGGGWIDGMNVDNYGEVSITLVYTAELPGDYGLYMSAAKEWNDAELSAFNVEVNGEKQATLRLAPAGSWDTAINSNVVKVSFKQGMNSVRLTVDTDLVTDKVDAVEKIKAVTVLDVFPEYTYIPAENGGAYMFRDGITTEADFGGKYNNAYRFESAEDSFSVTLNVKEAGNYDFTAYAARPSDAGEAALWVKVNNQDVYETMNITNLAAQDDRARSFKTQPVLNLALAAGENTVTFYFADDADMSAEKYAELMWLSVKYSENQNKKVLVTFEGEGVNLRPVSVNAGGLIVKPANPETENKFFDAWYNGEDKWDFTTPVTENLTLTARYGSSVTVSFEGEPDVQSIDIAYGHTLDVSELTYTKKPGFTVAFWTDSTKTQRFDFSAAITAPVSIYTTYEAIVYDPVTATEINLATATYSNVSWDGSKIDWGQNNGSVTFTYTAEKAGEYGMYLEYARYLGWGEYNLPQYKVTVNGTPASQVFTLVPTPDWGYEANSNAIAINLNAGENTIVLSTVVSDNINKYLAHIRKAFILDRYPEYDVLPEYVHAASATLTGSNPQYGGKFVDFNNVTNAVEFEVSVRQAGNFNLELMYAGDFVSTGPDSKATVEIYVNGEKTGTLNVARTENRDKFVLSEAAAIALVAGGNTVKIVLSTPLESGNFDLSAIRITEAVAED